MATQIDPFDAPTPGASLTTSPDERGPWEKPPKFVDPQNAIEEIFLRMTEDQTNLENITDLMRDGVPVEDIAQTLLYTGFREGLWSPDLILLLIEPVIYILLNMAEIVGIDAVLYPEDDFEEEEEFDSNLSRAARLRQMRDGGAPEETVAEEQVTANMAEPEVVPDSLIQRIKAATGGTEQNVAEVEADGN